MLEKSRLKLKFFITFSLMILFLSIATYALYDLNQIARVNREKQALSTKVTTVMKLFNCNNHEIHDAILETFDPILVAIVIGVESEYRVDAVSPTGCRGLMQLTPDKLADWKNPQKNIRVGAEYLHEQLQRFGKLELAIAAYNAGPESVSKYQGVPPFRETKEYVARTKLLNLTFRRGKVRETKVM